MLFYLDGVGEKKIAYIMGVNNMIIKDLAKRSKTLKNIYQMIRNEIYSTATKISPALNTKMRYRSVFGKKWDSNNLITLNDKILWLKLNTYNDNLLVKQCADKYRVREYIKEIGCEELLNDLIAVYDDPDAIEWKALPSKFVIKLNVDCECNIVVTDKNKLDINDTSNQLQKWMKERYYLLYSEMQYKDVKPYILIERYLQPKTGVLPEDYKFYCMNGRAEYVMVCIGRDNGGHPKFYFYDRNWNFCPFEEKEDPNLKKPLLIDKAFEYADKLSTPFPFVRTDLYLYDNEIIFGELTFTSAGGLDTGVSEEGMKIMGEMVDLKYSNDLN